MRAQFLFSSYTGFCPTIRFGYGQTYGNETGKYFQDYRSYTLRESKSPLAYGGCYPTHYSHNPEVVLSNLNTGCDRYLDRVNIELLNTDASRNSELKRFDLVSVVFIFQFILYNSKLLI